MPHEQEGFGKILSHDEDEVPRCSSVNMAFPANNNTDYRGTMPGSGRAPNTVDFIEWETPPAVRQDDCTFCFVMNTHLIPEYRAAYPYVTATFTVDGVAKIPVPIAYPRGYQTKRDGVRLGFEPRRTAVGAGVMPRLWEPNGVSGIYRITVPGSMISEGQPVRLRFTIDPSEEDVIVCAALSKRTDVLSLSLETLRDELTLLQSDMRELKLSHAMLQAKLYPELFPNYLIKAERGVAVVEETRHMHPPTLCKYDGDNILITYRRATDHLAADGACYAVRSYDKGRTFTNPEKLFDLGNSDHRCTPLFQISNGDLVGGDYRVGKGYDENGKFSHEKTILSPTLWGVWSDNRGKTWNFTKEPVSVPGAECPYAEMERPIIELPDGRLLLTATYCAKIYMEMGNKIEQYASGVWFSDNKGRSWEYLGSTEVYDGAAQPHHEVEPTIIRCRSGKLVMLMRTGLFGMASDWEKKGMHMQSESYDGGKTWSRLHPTSLSSQDTPAHLTLLSDGRLLATHASRQYPGSIYMTLSNDEGETWDSQNTKIVTQDLQNFDSTYPTTVQFSDGSLITVWYNTRLGKFHIGYARYGLEDL